LLTIKNLSDPFLFEDVTIFRINLPTKQPRALTDKKRADTKPQSPVKQGKVGHLQLDFLKSVLQSQKAVYNEMDSSLTIYRQTYGVKV
jgi:hypothetical protein